MTRAIPSFVTLTGCDRSEVLDDLVNLSQAYAGKIEFGILISAENAGTSRFPSQKTIEAIRRRGLRLSAHLCGSISDAIFAGNDTTVDVSGFSRAQINLSGRHAKAVEIGNAIRFGMERGIRVVLQCGYTYPDETRCDWLLDSSFGAGRRVEHFPDMTTTSAFCGVSGGLAPDNIGDVLETLDAADKPFWLDAESSLFDDGKFSAAHCIAFLRGVYGEGSGAD